MTRFQAARKGGTEVREQFPLDIVVEHRGGKRRPVVEVRMDRASRLITGYAVHLEARA